MLRHGINYLCLPWYFFKNHISCHVYKSYIMFLFNFFSLYLFSIFSSCIPSLCENIVFFSVLVAFFYPCSDLFSTHITFLPEIRSTFPPQDAQCWQQVNHHIVLIQYGHSNHFTLTTFGNPKCNSQPAFVLPPGFKLRPCGYQQVSAARTLKSQSRSSLSHPFLSEYT